MSDFENLDSFDTFLAIVAKLRGPDGCPWDRAQSHETLRRYLIEECHEAVDAIDEGDRAHLAEELGDVLLQVGLHAQIGADEGTFTIADVLRSINAKLLRRHPHVFGDAHASDADEVAANWQTLKEQERGAAPESVLDGAPNSLSALARSQELQRRAGKSGFEWEEIEGVLDKLREEIDEFKEAASPKEREHELGDILASVVNVARWVRRRRRHGDAPGQRALPEALPAHGAGRRRGGRELERAPPRRARGALATGEARTGLGARRATSRRRCGP